MSLELSDITGDYVKEIRTAFHMGRDAFAQQINMKSSAVWRIETKNNFNPGEKEHLLEVFNGMLLADTIKAPQAQIPQLEVIVDTPEVPPVVFVQPEVPPILDILTPSTQFSMPTLTIEQAFELVNQETKDILTSNINSLLGDLYKRVHSQPSGTPPTVVRQGSKAGITLSTILDAPPIEDPTFSPSPREMTAEDGITRYSNSELTTFKTCRRRWWLAYERNLKPRSSSVFGAANTGLRVHRALQHYYVPNDQPKMNILDAHAYVIDEDWNKIINSSGLEGVSPDVEIAFNKAVDLEKAMLEGYVEWLADTGADSELTVIAPEEYVEADLPGTNVRIIGRLDVRVRRNTDGFRGFMDHKTVGNFSEPVKLLPLNEQMLMYILLESLQSETPVFGAIYNMLRKVKRTATAKPPFYERVEVHHNKWELESFSSRLVGEIIDLQNAQTEVRANPQNHHSLVYPTPTRDCHWKCEFFQICPMFNDGSRVEDAISSLYQEHDPYAYYSQPIVVEQSSIE